MREIGGAIHDGPVAFTTTHWSVVLAAQGESPAADDALEKLCRIYWWPLYSFVRRQGYSPDEAQDLTQGFFAHLLERRDLDAVRREKGRLRSYLLAALKHFMTDARRRAPHGLTINANVPFTLVDTGTGSFPVHIVFTLINNTCASPISGRFSNLSNGLIRNSNGPNFKVSYIGGSGKDLILK